MSDLPRCWSCRRLLFGGDCEHCAAPQPSPWPPTRPVYVCGPAEFRELAERHGVKSAPLVFGGVRVVVTEHWPEGMPGKIIPMPARGMEANDAVRLGEEMRR